MANHLTVEERDRIAQLRHKGAFQKDIAEALGRDPATVSRELRRNRTGDEYYAAQAQRQYPSNGGGNVPSCARWMIPR